MGEINQICPLCGKDEHIGKQAKQLYGHMVCKKCYFAFINRRQFAFLLDAIIFNVLVVLFFSVFPVWSLETHRVLQILILYTWCLKDGFLSGSSPGKALMGVQVVDKTNYQPIKYGKSLKRNLPLLIPFMIIVVAIQLHKGYRIGDKWANTKVIWKKYRDKAPFSISQLVNTT